MEQAVRVSRPGETPRGAPASILCWGVLRSGLLRHPVFAGRKRHGGQEKGYASVMAGPKLHHYIPQFYLRRFADSDDRVSLHRRGTPRVVVTSVKNVAGETHLYRPDEAGQDTSAERVLGEAESLAAPVIDTVLATGAVPPKQSRERYTFALFCALQFTRTPEWASRLGFAEMVLRKLRVQQHVSLDQMRSYLRDVHLGFDPDEAEVQAAADFVNIQVSRGLSSKAEQLQQMFDSAVRVVAPRLLSLRWTLEQCPVPAFATCDRLPALWRQPTLEDRSRGVGLTNAEELWLPLNSSNMLVLKSNGVESTVSVAPSRATAVNQHLARHCYRFLFHHPALALNRADIRMAGRRPALRFNSAPGYTPTGHGDQYVGEIVHSWVPIRDDG